jgi:hypothetical protein
VIPSPPPPPEGLPVSESKSRQTSYLWQRIAWQCLEITLWKANVENEANLLSLTKDCFIWK